MKLPYTKPLVVIESYDMAQSISNNCGTTSGSTLGKPTHGDKSSCGWDFGGLAVWMEAALGCADVQIGADVPWDGVCYNNPNGGVAIFGS